jgi:HEAT repeat protein
VVAAGGPLAAAGAGQDAPAPDRARALVEALRGEDVEARRDAAKAVRNSERPVQRQALEVMSDLLKTEKDGQVRLAVLDTLAAMGPDAEPAIPALVHTLRTNYGGQGKEELHQDYRSALALAAIGKPAVEGLKGLLDERKENVRAEVVMALGRIGPDAEAAVPDLIRMLGDDNERIGREVSVALGRIGQAAVGPLIDACHQPETRVRTRAVEALGQLPTPDDRAREEILACARDDVPEVRAAAVGSLARLGVPDATLSEILHEDLRHEHEEVRLAAVNLLVDRWELLLPLAAELGTLLTSEQEGVSRHAAFLLGRIGPDAAPILLDGLRREGSRVDQVAEALAQIGRPIVGRLAEAVGDPEPRVRRGAALALGQIRPLAPGVVPKLTGGLVDPDPAVRDAFLTAIGSLGPRAGEAVPSVRTLLRDDSAEIRLKAIEVLSRSAPRDERLVDDLAALLDDPDARVQRRAIDTMRSLGPTGRKSLTLVIAKLGSPQAEVRVAAAEMIGSHGQAAAEAVPALGALLDDPSPELRTIAAQTLGRLGKASQPEFDRLTSLLDAEPVEVREAAASALGSLELDAEALRPHLARALRDREPRVRRAAMTSIQRLGPQGAIFVPDIILLAESQENLNTVERSLRRFERRGPDVRSVPELVGQLDHKQDSVRLLAIKFLGLAGEGAKDALPALERLREDSSEEVRKQAEAAIERIKNNAPPRQQSPGS